MTHKLMDKCRFLIGDYNSSYEHLCTITLLTSRYLHWAEWHYNIAFIFHIIFTFQMVYGRPLPSIPQYILASSNQEAINMALMIMDKVLTSLQRNLLKAQKIWRKCKFAQEGCQIYKKIIGYVSLQPYRQTSLTDRKYKELFKGILDLIKIAPRIGHVAYKLNLPRTSTIYHMSHVSLIYPYKGDPPQIQTLHPHSIDY